MREAPVLDPVKLLADAVAERLADTFRRTYGADGSPYPALIESGARFILERIGNSDALYHDVEHTMLVTFVGQEILRGRLVVERVEPADWAHFVFALLTHDIGFVRGVLPGDVPGRAVIDADGATVAIPHGASDAFLSPHHVERSKLFVRIRFGGVPYLDAERIARAIEHTRFPVPEAGDYAETGTEAGLVRAADLIGQLADPYYLRKLNALYAEFVETGAAGRLGLRSPADLVDRYPEFFWRSVSPYVGDALAHLERTSEGKQWIAQLYSHVFSVERHRARLGPEP